MILVLIGFDLCVTLHRIPIVYRDPVCAIAPLSRYTLTKSAISLNFLCV